MVEVPRAGRREWIGLGVIALPCPLYSMDLTVLYLAVPSRRLAGKKLLKALRHRPRPYWGRTPTAIGI
jgi:hypothetical protein